MKRVILAVLIVLLTSACATTNSTDGFHRYAACSERMMNGRILHDPGWVVSEMDGTGSVEFLSTYWGKTIQVTRVNRFCNALRSGIDASLLSAANPSFDSHR